MPTPVEPSKRSFPGAVGVIVFLGLLVVIVLVLTNSVFVIRSIEVEGNESISAQTVVDLSGIALGDSIFSINTSKVREGVNKDRYLQYVGIWRRFPDQLILSVKEDTPCAQIQWMGTLVMLGRDGIVLDQTSRIDTEISAPLVTGTSIAEVKVGKPLSLAAPGQLEAINQIIEELSLQGLSSHISELNVSNLDSLYLVSQDGLQIKLGSIEELPEKIAYMRAGMVKLYESGTRVAGGVLDVSTNKFADFMPFGAP